VAEDSQDILALAKLTHRRLASGALTPACAKLYSQHTRLDAGQESLQHWRTDEAAARLDDAVQLLDAAFTQRDAGDSSWNESVRRAGELLEWLAHPTLNSPEHPLLLLSAAAYQLAGYPARAAGVLYTGSSSGASGPLSALLRGDFPKLLRNLTNHWASRPRNPDQAIGPEPASPADIEQSLQRLVEDETASALGVLCSELRWGSTPRLEAALERLFEIARFMVHGCDGYSWLLARLTAETAVTFVAASLRLALAWVPDTLDSLGALAVERYVRQAYVGCRTQAWVSQQRGILRLKKGGSFALCTPTGSGKTTIAEIAILQALFAEQPTAPLNPAPLVMYLVPKRALAAEVEAKLKRTIATLSSDPIVITGLYGGIDWGPTDAWLTRDDRTVLICTYEKAEALIRFLGPLFLGRLVLTVLDEAHLVRHDGKADALRTAESRPLRLESLVARLLAHVPDGGRRVVALSAVATSMERSLAQWVTADKDATPEKTLYRSTRQLIGRLMCKSDRSFEIQYDLLDRASLDFSDASGGGVPFVPEPFPSCPAASGYSGPQKGLRPYLLWAAMHLVAPAHSARRHAVLVSVPQRIQDYAHDFLELIEDKWSNERLPTVFVAPTDPHKVELLNRCLLACEDYFGKQSLEYRLLARGIVAHHGKMPGSMARLLVQLVEEGVVHLILATSTLSEGVNLPFEIVLVPTLRRGEKWLEVSEIANLAGRAGRPGYGPEGKCLVLLSDQNDRSANDSASRYRQIVAKLTLDNAESQSTVQSALATLIEGIFAMWATISRSIDQRAFTEWLETATTLDQTEETGERAILTETLDSLDSILLAAVVEVETLAGHVVSADELEKRLAEIWGRTYAHYASAEERTLGKWFVTRGGALATTIYPDAAERRRLYRTGLPPRLGEQLTSLFPKVRAHLESGSDYAVRDADGRFEFVAGLVDLLAAHPRFAPTDRTPGGADWRDMLRWWLDPHGPTGNPGPKKVSAWYDYVATNFGYRFAWGIGCVLALAANDAHDGVLQPTTLEEWPELDLPWIALWLKELIVWGTLDPVTAYLLGRGKANTRDEANALADQYYSAHGNLEPDAQLNPKTIRRWANKLLRTGGSTAPSDPVIPSDVRLERDFSASRNGTEWRVLPADHGTRLRWVDPAGYLLATSERPPGWSAVYLDKFDFFLDVDRQAIRIEPYL
jgi:hypothetical protein